jgi:integrase
LVGSGVRASELCALNWRNVNLVKGRLHVLDAKTPTGVREVELSPWLVGELLAFGASVGSVGLDTPVFATSRGSARDR